MHPTSREREMISMSEGDHQSATSMCSTSVPAEHVPTLMKDREALEECLGISLCLAKCSGGHVEVRPSGSPEDCKRAKAILDAMSERKFHSYFTGSLGEKERWNLMKKHGLYIHCASGESVDVYGTHRESIPMALNEISDAIIECIVLDDSQNGETTQPVAANKDDSIVFLGTFPGQPARRRKANAIVAEEEKCQEMGLPYDPITYKLNGRHPVPIAIDGSNVAREHGLSQRAFSCKGIKIAVDFFCALGHSPVRAFVPRYIRENAEHCRVPVLDVKILDELCSLNKLTFTPSTEEPDGRLIVPYDDRFILNYAVAHAAVVLSNDRYRDIAGENPKFAHIASNRLLSFSFAKDLLMVPIDPKGRHGPRLMEFLSEPILSKSNDEQASATATNGCVISGPLYRRGNLLMANRGRRSGHSRRGRLPKRLSSGSAKRTLMLLQRSFAHTRFRANVLSRRARR